MYKIFVVAFLLIFAGNVFAQDTTQLKLPPNVKSGSKTLTDLIAEKGQTKIGLLTIHKIDDRYFLEIKKKILGKDILLVSRLIRSAAEMRSTSMLGYGGDQINEKEIRFEISSNHKLLIRQVSYAELSKDTTQVMYRSVMNSNLQAIAASFDVKAFSKNNDGIIIDVTDYLNGDNDLLFFDPNIKKTLNIGQYQPDKSYIERLNTYPNNTEIKTVKTYLKAAPVVPPGFPMVQPSGTVTVELNCSIILLPERVMRARLADQRIGYFSTGYTDFDADPQSVKNTKMIQRWRLEPKEEDRAKYFRGELVEPVKPIVFYIDPATPAKWVPYLMQGINDWQKAFEKAGFKNAIMAKKAPTPAEDPTWSLEDARYSALVYKPSVIPNASGPNVHDPRTGEILESHINWYHNIMHLVHNWYMIQCAAVDPKARTMHFDDELMGQLIRFVSSHEVGHTLGLMHNYGSSSTVPIDSLRNKIWVELHGHTPSIMDYARFNYVAQPEDHISEAGLLPRIGDYDLWAIEWGYKLLPNNPSPKDEVAVLNKITLNKLKNKRLWFGRENNPNDPRSQSEDVGDNAMKAGAYGLKNIKYLLAHLQEWTETPNENYDDLKEIYGEVLNQFVRYMGHVTKNVGGIYETPKTIEQAGPVFINVPREKQQQAVAFLNEQLFSTPKWLFNKAIMNRIGNNGVEIAGVLQSQQLDVLLSPRTFTKLIAGSAENEKTAYSVQELLADLQKGIWTELDTHRSIDVYRRNLQKNYVADLEKLIASPTASSSQNNEVIKTDGSSLARTALIRLKSKIIVVLPGIKDEPSRSHLQDVLYRITKMTELPKA